MPTFILSGAHVAAKFGIFNTDALLNYGENKLLGKAAYIPDSLLQGNAFMDFPYLSSIAVTVEGGVRQVQAIGLPNIAALEEEAIGFQDVTIEVLAQPLQSLRQLFSIFKRTAANRYHFPFVALRCAVRGLYYIEEEGKGWADAWLDFWACVPRTITFNQPEGAPATVRVTLGAGYIHPQIPAPSSFSMFYDISKGILNIFEGVMELYDSANNRILPEFPLLVTSFSLDIRNTINPLHTYMMRTFSDPLFMRAVRMWRALWDGIQNVEGNFTVVTMNRSATFLNVNKLRSVARIEIKYYPFVGANAPTTPPTNPEFTIRLYNVKFTRSTTNIRPDGALQWTTNFVASQNYIGQEAWDVVVS